MKLSEMFYSIVARINFLTAALTCEISYKVLQIVDFYYVSSPPLKRGEMKNTIISPIYSTAEVTYYSSDLRNTQYFKTKKPLWIKR